MWITAGLGAATTWMAYETRRLANTTVQAARAAATPDLAFAKFEILPARQAAPTGGLVQGLVAKVYLHNPGQTRVGYQVKKVLLAVDGTEYPRSDLVNRGAVLHRSQEMYFSYPFVPWTGEFKPGTSGTFDFEAEFWADSGDRHARDTLSFRLQYTVNSIVERDGQQVVTTSWVFANGPTYG